MVKAIMSTPVVRKAAATVMFATAVIGANASNLKTEESNKNVNQTEVVSKEAALALQSNVVSGETFSGKPYNKQARIFLDSCENEEELKNTKLQLYSVYKEQGTFGATITCQLSLEQAFALSSIRDLSSNKDFLARNDVSDANDAAVAHDKWMHETFFGELHPQFNEFLGKGIQSAEASMKFLDDYVKNSKLVKDSSKAFYQRNVAKVQKGQDAYYKNNMSEYDPVQAKAAMVAYRVHVLFSATLVDFVCDYLKINPENEGKEYTNKVRQALFENVFGNSAFVDVDRLAGG